MKKILVFIAVVFLLVSCEVTAPERYSENKLVIAGYLKAGEMLSVENAIFVGKTVDVEGDYIEDILLEEADVTLINTATQDSFMLFFGINIDENENITFGYYNNFVQIEPSVTYRIEVEAEVDSEMVFAWAETTVPELIDVDLDYYNNATADYGFSAELPDIFPESVYDDVDKEFPVHISLNTGDVVYLNYKFYCLEEFSTSLEFTEPFADFTHLDEEDEDNYYSVMSNNIRESSMLWRYQPTMDEFENWFLIDDVYKEGFRYYGRWKLTVYIVDENYYTYNYHSENQLHGGVHGGIGYFGSVAGEDFYTKIIKQDN